jgi:hypothetical protein
MSLSPETRVWHARWTATSEVEHKVCTVIGGPGEVELVGGDGVRESRSLNTPSEDMPAPARPHGLRVLEELQV